MGKHISPTKLSKKDQEMMVVHFIEKSMRKITKIIKQKRKMLIKKGKAYDAILNSYNISLYELKEYEKKRDELLIKVNPKLLTNGVKV